MLKQYEYLVLTVSPEDSLPEARRRLVEHSEYGKWELERSSAVCGRRHGASGFAAGSPRSSAPSRPPGPVGAHRGAPA